MDVNVSNWILRIRHVIGWRTLHRIENERKIFISFDPEKLSGLITFKHVCFVKRFPDEPLDLISEKAEKL